MRFGLLHSPATGPFDWSLVGSELEAAGHVVAIPDVRSAAQTGRPEALADAAAASMVRRADVLVGHSGAGCLLPLVAALLAQPPSRLVFVDAVIPPCAGTCTLGGTFLPALRSLAVDGVLPTWAQWWPAGSIEAELPDPTLRARFVAELRELPLSLYEAPIDVPEGWCDLDVGYLRLSDGYRAEADVARVHHWAVIEHEGHHLDVLNQPRDVAADLLALVAR